jgi:hypothetical protein
MISDKIIMSIVCQDVDEGHEDDVRFVLDQHIELDFFSAGSLKQQVAGRHVTPLRHIILIPSQPSGLYLQTPRLVTQNMDTQH